MKFFSEEEMKKLSSFFQRISNELPSSLMLLSKYGWYISSCFPLSAIIELNSCCEKGDIEKVDDFFVDYYESEMFKIEKRLVNKRNNRKSIISEGVLSHKEEKYYASTLIFLSTADGLCESFLFKTKDNKKELVDFLLSVNHTDDISYSLKPITTRSNIDVYHKSKDRLKSSLNRHEVMHGISTDYGTKVNSLKAFSLLSYVSDFYDRHK